jgi:ankyrin repeat protein
MKDLEGKTALHHAAMNDTSIVKMLVDAGADLDNQDSDGKSPLHYAVYKN